MKIFDSNDGGWAQKVNFVDDNNVLVGYDMGQSCCERADWFITKEIATTYDYDGELSQPRDLDGWQFDPEFFQEVVLEAREHGYSALDAGGMVAFKLVKGKKVLYLHLFNSHNGYYGHGFTVTIGGKVVREDSL